MHKGSPTEPDSQETGKKEKAEPPPLTSVESETRNLEKNKI